jgi:hypothetical protein
LKNLDNHLKNYPKTDESDAGKMHVMEIAAIKVCATFNLQTIKPALVKRIFIFLFLMNN